jgi:elongation of very long chain fatty acids protein 4
MNHIINDLEVALIRWGNPKAIEMSLPAMNGWLLHRLDHALAVLLVYALFVLFGFKFLYNPKPKVVGAKSKLKLTVRQKFSKEPLIFPLMVIYNTTQVGLCAYMVYEALKGKADRGFGLLCNAHELMLKAESRGIASVLHVFYLTKVLDFADTVFMIIRGKWNQVTFLHIYHHSSIFIIYWLILNSAYDGDIYLTVVLNGTIHFIMYFYYLITTFNISVPRPIKMMVTNMQLIQFVCMISQGVYLLLMACPYPTNVTRLYVVYILSMLALFLNFKRKAYGSKKKKN